MTESKSIGGFYRRDGSPCTVKGAESEVAVSAKGGEGTSQSRVAFFAQMLLRRMNLVHARISHSTLLPPTSEYSIHMQLCTYTHTLYSTHSVCPSKWVTQSTLLLPTIPPLYPSDTSLYGYCHRHKSAGHAMKRTAEGFQSQACPHAYVDGQKLNTLVL